MSKELITIDVVNFLTTKRKKLINSPVVNINPLIKEAFNTKVEV